LHNITAHNFFLNWTLCSGIINYVSPEWFSKSCASNPVRNAPSWKVKTIVVQRGLSIM